MPLVKKVKDLIRDIKDFPIPGVVFRDITPVLQSPEAFRAVIVEMTQRVKQMRPDIVIGIESRGFMLGTPIALELGIGFIPVRKPGKLPFETVQIAYDLEYGCAAIEMHVDAIQPGMRVAIIDDVLATGGTAEATGKLVEKIGGTVVGFSFMIELCDLNGRSKISDYPVDSLIEYVG